MKYLTLFSIICAAIFVTSCGEDPIPGCTDPLSSTYDPLATEDSGSCKYPGCTDEDGDNYDATFNQDDGSCTYFDRFLGDYSGIFVCLGPLSGLLDEASSKITKTPGDDNMDKITVIVSNPATAITLLLSGTITKDVATIDTYIENFEYTLDTGTGFVIEGPFEVFVTGTLTRAADNSLSGPISIRIDKAELGLSVPDDCTYNATLD